MTNGRAPTAFTDTIPRFVRRVLPVPAVTSQRYHGFFFEPLPEKRGPTTAEGLLYRPLFAFTLRTRFPVLPFGAAALIGAENVRAALTDAKDMSRLYAVGFDPSRNERRKAS